MSKPKIKATITVEWEVSDLSIYHANTIQEAAALTQQQFDNKELSVEDILFLFANPDVKIEAIESKKECAHESNGSKELITKLKKLTPNYEVDILKSKLKDL